MTSSKPASSSQVPFILNLPPKEGEDDVVVAPKSLKGGPVQWIKKTWSDASTPKKVMMVAIPIILLLAGLGIAGWQTGFFESASFKDFFNTTIPDWFKGASSLTNGQVVGISGGIVGTIILLFLAFKCGPKAVQKIRANAQEAEVPKTTDEIGPKVLTGPSEENSTVIELKKKLGKEIDLNTDEDNSDSLPAQKPGGPTNTTKVDSDTDEETPASNQPNDETSIL